MNAPVRILLIDDHFAVRAGLRASLGLETDLEVVGEAGSGREAVMQYRNLRPDLAILDGRLPDMDGPGVARTIQAEFPAARILLLSVHEGEEDIFRALDAGALGYVAKSADRWELLTAVREVARGRSYLSSTMRERLAAREARPTLTEREGQVLVLLVRGGSNKEIAGALQLAEITVKQHVSSILGKLGVQDRTQAALAAVQRGIVHLEG